MCAVVCRHDHVVHRKSFGLCCECNVHLVHGGMENVLSCVFPVERCVNVDKLVNDMQCASPDGCGVRSGGEGRPGDVDY